MTPSDEAMLALCPFCAGKMMFRKALWPSDGNVDAIIHAADGTCGMADFADGSTDESIIAKWNTRAAPQPSASSHPAESNGDRTGRRGSP